MWNCLFMAAAVIPHLELSFVCYWSADFVASCYLLLPQQKLIFNSFITPRTKRCVLCFLSPFWVLKGPLNFEFFQYKQRNESTQWNIESRNIESKKLRPCVHALQCILHVALVKSQKKPDFWKILIASDLHCVSIFSCNLVSHSKADDFIKWKKKQTKTPNF